MENRLRTGSQATRRLGSVLYGDFFVILASPLGGHAQSDKPVSLHL
jgi:hypothetical protein